MGQGKSAPTAKSFWKRSPNNFTRSIPDQCPNAAGTFDYGRRLRRPGEAEPMNGCAPRSARAGALSGRWWCRAVGQGLLTNGAAVPSALPPPAQVDGRSDIGQFDYQCSYLRQLDFNRSLKPYHISFGTAVSERDIIAGHISAQEDLRTWNLTVSKAPAYVR